MLKFLRYSSPIIIAAYLIMIGQGCSGTKEKTQKLNKIDSLEKTLHHLESTLKTMDVEQVKLSYVNCKDKLQKLYVVFLNDPLIVDENLLIEYEKLKVNLNKLVLDIENAEKEIQYGVQQLTLWKEAIIKKKTKDKEFNVFCNSRSESIHSLELIIVKKSKEWGKYREIISRLDPQVKKLIGNS